MAAAAAVVSVAARRTCCMSCCSFVASAASARLVVRQQRRSRSGGGGAGPATCPPQCLVAWSGSRCGSTSRRGRQQPSLQSACVRASASAALDSDGDGGGGGVDLRDPSVIVLGIETSCDETAAAVVRGDGTVLGEALASQPEMLAEWGGVVPKLAQSGHERAIDGVVQQALDASGVAPQELSAVAVTIGPGLSLCLKIGILKARSLAREHRLPIVPIHHMEAHALVARALDAGVRFPFLTLLVSGGHNLLLVAHGVGKYTQLGTTLDDALGEAYDKSARLLGLDMTLGGGPVLEHTALSGDPSRFKFPVPMRGKPGCNFSYAGLKTAVRTAVQRELGGLEYVVSEENEQVRADIAASFQHVAVAHLVERTRRALDWAREIEPGLSCMVVAGGVAANKVVRSRLTAAVAEWAEARSTSELRVVFPPPRLCTDNGVMAAWAGVERYQLGLYDPPPAIDSDDALLDIRPRWPLGSVFARGESDARSLKLKHSYPTLSVSDEAFAAATQREMQSRL